MYESRTMKLVEIVLKGGIRENDVGDESKIL
jgi:hypothetical protein